MKSIKFLVKLTEILLIWVQLNLASSSHNNDIEHVISHVASIKLKEA